MDDDIKQKREQVQFQIRSRERKIERSFKRLGEYIYFGGRLSDDYVVKLKAVIAQLEIEIAELMDEQ